MVQPFVGLWCVCFQLLKVQSVKLLVGANVQNYKLVTCIFKLSESLFKKINLIHFVPHTF